MKNKMNKIQIVKSIVSLFAIFLFNLPTLAALNINYSNLFIIPDSDKPANKNNLIAEETDLGTGTAVEATEEQPTPNTEDLPLPLPLPLPSSTPSLESDSSDPLAPNSELINNNLEPSPSTTPPNAEIDHNKSFFETPKSCNSENNKVDNFSFTNSSFQGNIIPLSLSAINAGNTSYLLLGGISDGQTIGTVYKSSESSFSKISSFAISPEQSNKLFSFSGDFNGDSFEDFAVINSSKQEIVLATFNSQENTFTTETDIFSLPFEPTTYSTGDINLDGKTDIILSGSDNTIKFLISDSNSSDLTFVTYDPDIKISSTITSIKSADFNNDGFLDFAAAIPSENKINIFISSKPNIFNTPITIETGVAFNKLAVSDIDSDKIIDLIATCENPNNIATFKGDKTGNFTKAASYSLIAPALKEPFIFDLNGDCKNDIIVASKDSETFSYLNGNGNGTFKPSSEYPLAKVIDAIALDLNGDGYKDIAAVSSDKISILIRGEKSETQSTENTEVKEGSDGVSVPTPICEGGSPSCSDTNFTLTCKNTSNLIGCDETGNPTCFGVDFSGSNQPTKALPECTRTLLKDNFKLKIKRNFAFEIFSASSSENRAYCEDSMAKCLNTAFSPTCPTGTIRLCSTRNNDSEPICLYTVSKILTFSRCGVVTQSDVPLCLDSMPKCNNTASFSCLDPADMKLCTTRNNGSEPICLNSTVKR